jgi:hypothetical protein
MSKHHRTAGVDYRIIKINGKPYKARSIRTGDYAAMESYIISTRPDPLDIASAAVARLPKSQHDAIWKVAMDRAISARTVTPDQAKDFENSFDGLAWTIWQCLKDNHPELDTIEAARDLLASVNEEDMAYLLQAIQLASGQAELGKSTGQAETEAEAAGQPSTAP